MKYLFLVLFIINFIVVFYMMGKGIRYILADSSIINGKTTIKYIILFCIIFYLLLASGLQSTMNYRYYEYQEYLASSPQVAEANPYTQESTVLIVLEIALSFMLSRHVIKSHIKLKEEALTISMKNVDDVKHKGWMDSIRKINQERQ